MKSKVTLSTQEIIILNYLKKHPNKGNTASNIYENVRFESLITAQELKKSLDILIKASKIIKWKLKEKELYIYLDGKTLVRPENEDRDFIGCYPNEKYFEIANKKIQKQEIKNTPEQITFEKTTKEEKWFNGDCSDENLLKQCNREFDTIFRVQFEDGKYIGSILHVYFNVTKCKLDIIFKSNKQEIVVKDFDLSKESKQAFQKAIEPIMGKTILREEYIYKEGTKIGSTKGTDIVSKIIHFKD